MSNISNSIFILNDKGLIEINKLEARSKKEYRALIERDKGSDGDYDGRKKYKALREFLYMYMLLDPRSMYYNLPYSERHKKAKIHAGFHNTWAPDEVLKEAMIQYEIDLKLDAVANAYIAAERNYFNTAEDINEMQNNLSELKRLIKSTMNQLVAEGTHTLGDIERVNSIEKVIALSKQLLEIQMTSTKLINELPKMNKIVNDLKAAYAESGGELKIVVGNRELGNRED